MRICIIGKYPPIQGGVSARTYWTAHDLAARGHEVHVFTNAKEARPPFRMHMRRQDWRRCEAVYEPAGSNTSTGSVTVHWTDPVDNSQFYIPMASAFVSKLAGAAAGVHAERSFDVIYSHYLEPYGIAGHLVADIARVPHVVRMAGSDAGRLWRHPQHEALYDHVLRSAAIVITAGVVAGRALKHGIRPERIAAVGSFTLPEDLFCPEGPRLDLAALRQEVERDPDMRDTMWGGFAGELPYFGIYGKLGETKGSFALLAAIQRLKQQGLAVGLVAMAHGWPALEGKFRARAEELGIADRVLQIPFLPHWRVPEFLCSCLAVCCLEQDFPIVFHTPVIAREVLTCGSSCLIGSTEVIRKLTDHERLPDGYGCVAIQDVQDVTALSARLSAIARDPEPIAAVAARGRAFARSLQPDAAACGRLEQLLKTAARRRAPGRRRHDAIEAHQEDPRFPITQLAGHRLEVWADQARTDPGSPSQPIDLPRARAVLRAAEAELANGDTGLRPVAAAIGLEIAIAEAEETQAPDTAQAPDPLFRFPCRRWALGESDLANLRPVRDPQLRLLTVDVAALTDFEADPDKGQSPLQRSRHVAAFAGANDQRREPLFISDTTARILDLSDGTRSARDIAAQVTPLGQRGGTRRTLEAIEELFVAGLLLLEDGPIADAEMDRLGRRKSA